MAADDSTHNIENSSQTEGSKSEQFKGEMQEAETQIIQNADNTPKQPTVTNPMVRGNNNNDLIADTRDKGSTDFLSELLSNQFGSDEERKNDTTQNTQINCNSSDVISELLINQSFVSGGIQTPTPQNMKKRKWNKNKK